LFFLAGPDAPMATLDVREIHTAVFHS